MKNFRVWGLGLRAAGLGHHCPDPCDALPCISVTWLYWGTSLIRDCRPTLGPPYVPRHRPTEGSYGGGASYGRDTPVGSRGSGPGSRIEVSGCREQNRTSCRAGTQVMLWILDFRFGGLGFVFCVLCFGFGFWILGFVFFSSVLYLFVCFGFGMFRFWVLGFGSWVFGFGSWVRGIGYHNPSYLQRF